MSLISLWLLLGACFCLTTANNSAYYDESNHMVNMPPQAMHISGFSENFDPCSLKPCAASGRICKHVPREQAETGFVCADDASHSITENWTASQFYRNMEQLYQEAIMQNIENIATAKNGQQSPALQTQFNQLQLQRQPYSTPSSYEQHVMLSLKSKKPIKLSCDQKPCHEGERCIMKPETAEGFVCVRERITIVQNENTVIEKLKNDQTFMSETITRCKAAQLTAHQRLEIQSHPTLFIDCQLDNEILTCPEGLVFNKFLDRCDIDQQPMSSGCASSPCHFGGVCHEMSDLDYRCDCPPGFTGKNCEHAPDVCAVAPCGNSDGNICHVLPPESGLTYFCTCFSGKAYGLSCEEDKIEKNPCEENFQVGSVFSTRISPSVFGMCDDERQLQLRVCDKQMQAAGKCRWMAKLASHRKRRSSNSHKNNKRKHSIRKHY